MFFLEYRSMARQRLDRGPNVRRLMLIPSKEEQDLIEKANQLQDRVRANPDIRGLLQELKKLVRMHCNSLLPMSAGYYRPLGTVLKVKHKEELESSIEKIMVEADERYETAHLAGHSVSHTAHYVLEILMEYELIHLPHAFTSLIPVVGTLISCGATLLQSWYEHDFIHQVAKQIKKLLAYDDSIREAIYSYAISRVLLAVAPLLEDKEDPEKNKNILKGLPFLIYAQSLESLTRVKHVESGEDLAQRWSQHVINRFVLQNLIKPRELAASSTDFARLRDLKSQVTAILVPKTKLPELNWFQGIFVSNYSPQSVVHYNGEELEAPLLKILYSKFLSPYAHRVSVPDIWSQGFAGYSQQDLTYLKKYYYKIDETVRFVQTQMPKLVFSQAYGELLAHVNNGLFKTVHNMRKSIPWPDIKDMAREIDNLAVEKRTFTVLSPAEEELALDPALEEEDVVIVHGAEAVESAETSEDGDDNGFAKESESPPESDEEDCGFAQIPCLRQRAPTAPQAFFQRARPAVATIGYKSPSP